MHTDERSNAMNFLLGCVRTQKNPEIMGENGASDGLRTHDLLHGKQMLYQLSYTRVREPIILTEPAAFGKRFLVFKVVDHHAFAAGFEDFFNKVHVQRVFLVGVLGGFILKHEVQRDLVGLIDHIAVAGGHFAAVIMQHARAGLEVLLGAGQQFLGGIGHIGFGPENDNV